MSAHRILKDIYDADKLIVDPSDGDTLTVTEDFKVVNSDTTGGAKGFTLARPLKEGLQFQVTLAVDGGNLTVTVTGGIDQAGNTTITFDDAGDTAVLVSIKVGSDYRWLLVIGDGTSQS